MGVPRRRVFLHLPKIERVLLGGVCALVVALVNVTLPAMAAPGLKHKTSARHLARAEPFGTIPNGPLQIFISIDQQQLHLYSDGVHVADAPVATGVPAHPTPTGVFSVIDKERFHRSNIYSNAPMPYMQRITWSGVALHEGVGLGHPASHGCIRMPHDFAVRLWALTRRGARVMIARPELRPAEISDPHLFTHRELAPVPPPPPPAPTADAVQTAQSIDTRKTTDAVQSAETPHSPAPAEATQSDGDNDPPAADPEPADPAPAAAQDNSTAPNAAASPPAAETPSAAPADAAPQVVPMPPPKPAEAAEVAKPAAKRAPISIFVSRKESRIYVRQKFSPLFDAPITIADRDRPLGTHVFTAMNYVDDGSTFRWTVVSMPGALPKPSRKSAIFASGFRSHAKTRGKAALAPNDDPPPPDSPEDALSRIEIPQDVIDRISALLVPGSSLVVSDQGLGEETGEGTDFIVIAR